MSPHRNQPFAQWPLPVKHIACDAFVHLTREPSPEEFWHAFVASVIHHSNTDTVLLVKQQRKAWQILASEGPQAPGAQEIERLAGLALDESGCACAAQYCAVGLRQTTPPGVLIASASDPTAEMQDALIACGDLICILDRAISTRQRLQSTCQRQSAMLRIAASWQQESGTAALLELMAQTATELLDAQRASIFLWDKRRRVLMGQPALGVDGGQLEVDDSAGVVGAVLQSGEPKRWDGSDNESEVNRKVDAELSFHTTSLLAVPMDNRQGKRIGVFEVINKNNGAFTQDDEVTLAELAGHAAIAIENTQKREHLAESCDKLADAAAQGAQIIGNSAPIIALRDSATKVAKTDLSVLILGHNGTGKEVLARTIHLSSTRRCEPFVAVNCAALVESLLESELFGHEKGAFTDAHETRHGKFEVASGGTLFLDEIGDMSLSGQAKLLRVLEEKVIVRVGGSTPIPIDVRVIAATNQPLSELVSQKKFREDLYFRLNVVTLELPALKERGDDVIVLAEHFLESFAAQIGRIKPELAADAKSALLSHSWRGNIRELRNLIERVSYLCSADKITAEDLWFSQAPEDSTTADLSNLTLNDATRKFQVNHIQTAINRCGRNMTEAAERLGLHRSNLYRKMKQLGLEVND